LQTTIKFSRENELVKLPTKSEEDAGFDLYVDPEWLKEQGGEVIITPQETKLFPTGLRSVIEPNYYAQIQERGSTGVKALKYGAGVIDSGFRGVWQVLITNCSNKSIRISNHEKEGYIHYSALKGIAQFVVLPVPKTSIEEATIDEVLKTPSHRGEGMLGSSGK
jgi:dUTP pyrophosphatase